VKYLNAVCEEIEQEVIGSWASRAGEVLA